MRRTPVILLAAMLSACQSADPAVEGAWIRLSAVAGRPASAYMTVRGGAADAVLTGVATPAAGRTELHETMAAHGPGAAHRAMTMTPLARVPVPRGTLVEFAPGGRHVMLFDVRPDLSAGGTAALTLAFADGRTLTTQAAVVGAADPAPR